MLAVSCLLSSHSSEKHVRRRDVFRVVVEDAPQPPDITDRAKGRSTDLANALGERVGHGGDLAGLFAGNR
jgi:hypothetical protein